MNPNSAYSGSAKKVTRCKWRAYTWSSRFHFWDLASCPASRYPFVFLFFLVVSNSLASVLRALVFRVFFKKIGVDVSNVNDFDFRRVGSELKRSDFRGTDE
jgi:hypothetical protein